MQERLQNLLMRHKGVLFISLALDLFPDLPSQLSGTKRALQTWSRVSGVIHFFSERTAINDDTDPLLSSLIDPATRRAFSSGLLLVLFLLFLIFMLVCFARFTCFWQRFRVAHSRSNRSVSFLFRFDVQCFCYVASRFKGKTT